MMNQEDLFKKLGTILNELNDQYEYLAQNPQKFNELELELFLANASFLADHIQIIRKLNSNKTLKELPEHTQTQEDNVVERHEPDPVDNRAEPAAAEPAEPQFINEPTEQTFKIDQEPVSFEFVLHEKPQAEVAELPLEEEPEVDDQNQQINPEPFLVEKEEEKIPLPTSTLVVDEIEDKVVKPTLNDLLANSLKKDNAEPAVASGPRIKDLKQAINLNDKLLYIKDLFNGYNLAYSEAIELINKMPDFKTADAFLKSNYAVKNSWAAKQATVDRFYELLHRRF